MAQDLANVIGGFPPMNYSDFRGTSKSCWLKVRCAAANPREHRERHSAAKSKKKLP
jgi:hypothetical protein